MKIIRFFTQKNKFAGFITSLIVLLAFSGCTSTRIVGGGPYEISELVKAKGLVYYPGKSMVFIEVTKTTKTEKQFTKDLSGIKKEVEITYDGEAKLKTVADRDYPFLLNIKPGNASEDTITIETREGGRLKMVNFDIKGKGGDIIKSIAKFVAVVLPLAPEIHLGGVAPSQQTDCIDWTYLSFLPEETQELIKNDQDACNKWIELGQLNNELKEQIIEKNRRERSLKIAKKEDKKEIQDEINIIEEKIKNLKKEINSIIYRLNILIKKSKSSKNSTCPDSPGLPIDIRKLITTAPEACTLWEQMRNLDAQIEGMQKQRLDKEKKLVNAGKEEAKTLKECIDSIAASIKNLEKQKSSLNAQFQIRLEVLKEEYEIGTKKEVETFSMVFKIEEIPKKLEDLKGQKQMKNFLTKSGILVTLEPLYKVTNHGNDNTTVFDKKRNGTPVKNRSSNSKVNCQKGIMIDDYGYIYYRQSVPMRLTIYGYKGDTRDEDLENSEEKLSIIFQQAVHVMHPNTDLYRFGFKSNVFADKSLAISFDENGRPMTITKKSTSSLKNVADSLADAAISARDNYAETLNKITEIQDSQRKIALNELTTRVEKLKKEKEALDAQLELEGATSNYDLLLKQKQLDQELKTLEARINLEKTIETQEMTIELSKIKAQLEYLQKELELLKAAQQIEDIKNDQQ